MRFPSRFRDFIQQKRGVVAVEFALILPLLLIFYLGAFEGSQAISADRRVESVADTVGNLVSRSSTMDATRLNNIMAISKAILAPFPNAGLVMTVTTVRVDANGKATVDWSKTNTGTALAAGSVYVLPKDLQGFTDTYLVFSTTAYPYKTLLGYNAMIGNIAMGETSSFRPRKSAEIPFS